MSLRLEEVSFEYGGRSAIRKVSLELVRGEVVAILGPNGAGKSTLLKCIANLYLPKSGAVSYKGKLLQNYSPRQRARMIGFVPQHFSPSIPMTVLEVVLMGRTPHLRWGITTGDLVQVERILNELKLTSLAKRYISELSGGERQKVMLARALAQQPEVMLLDEPITGLDIRHQLEALNTIQTLVRKNNTSAVMVLHDLELASRYADRIILMKQGEVYATGHPSAVLTEQNLQQVYGIESMIEPIAFGLNITPVRPI